MVCERGADVWTRTRRTNGGPGCSSLEGLLQENGVSHFSCSFSVRAELATGECPRVCVPHPEAVFSRACTPPDVHASVPRGCRNTARLHFVWSAPPHTAPAAGPLRSHLSDIACRSTDFTSDLQPFQWNYGQAGPSQNEFSWTNLSSMIYLEQPVGTGFSQGKPTARVSRESASRSSAGGN